MSILWWEQWPGRLDYELEELKRLSISYKIDEEAFKGGLLVLTLTYNLNGKDIELEITFPELYPYFRFEVKAPFLDLPKHQNPFGKNLCLVGRSTENWDPRDNLAKFLSEQLPKVIDAQKGPVDFEEQQGEPISAFYTYERQMILIDSAWQIPKDVNKGNLVLGIIEQLDVSRLAVLRVEDKNKKVFATCHPSIKALYPREERGRWVRIAEALKINDPEQYYKQLIVQFPDLQNFSWKNIKGANAQYDVIGVTFPEEVGYNKYAGGWLFIIVFRVRGKVGKKNRWQIKYTFARAGRAGINDVLERVPNVSELKSKKVAVVGLGSIGAPSAVEFARNCLNEIRLLDFDYLEPGNTVRWPFGFSAVGHAKIDYLNFFISKNYPYTNVKSEQLFLGGLVNGNSQLERINSFLEGVDLVYDASAELGVHHLLADLCREKNIAFVLSSATHGAWGGMVTRFTPETDCCWQCFERSRTEGKIELPPEDPQGIIQPVSCADPTFTGTNFDLQEVALCGVRLAIDTLLKSNNPASGYNWNGALLSLRDQNGRPCLPDWKIINMVSFEDCPICKKG